MGSPKPFPPTCWVCLPNGCGCVSLVFSICEHQGWFPGFLGVFLGWSLFGRPWETTQSGLPHKTLPYQAACPAKLAEVPAHLQGGTLLQCPSGGCPLSAGWGGVAGGEGRLCRAIHTGPTQGS